jgi:hypothetical protein
MKDLGPLHHFLDITIEHRSAGLFLHQRTYMLDILKRAVMADCKSCTTPVDLQEKLVGDSGPPVEDTSKFWSIAGALQYLRVKLPNIVYVVQQICLHMHDPQEPHLMVMKRIMLSSGDVRLQSSSTSFVRAALTSSSTRTLTGSIVQTLAALHQAMRCS